jgi:hypothetical protein
MEIYIYTDEPLVSETILVKAEIAITKLKINKSPSIDQIVAELIKARGGKSCSEIHKLFVLYSIGRNCQSSGRNLLL